MQPRPQQPGQEGNPAMFGMVLLGLVCLVVAFPTLVLAALVWLLVRHSRAGQVGMLLLGFAGLGFVAWQWVALQTVAGAVVGAVSDLPYQANGWGVLWGQLVRLWGLTVPVAPLLGVLFALSRAEGDAVVSKATSRPLPEQAEGHAVLGQALGGDLAVCRVGRNAVYPNALLARHAVVVGGSGSGKTEALLRIAYLAAKVYGWKVFYLDAKGDRDTAAKFAALMEQAGIEHQAMFPAQAYNGWKGDATAIFNRLMRIEDFSETFYKGIAKDYLQLVCTSPKGTPRSSVQLLDRLWIDRLAQEYEGDPRQREAGDFDKTQVLGLRKRYRGFFNALSRKLDGVWDFGSVQAGYLLLDGLALQEEAVSLGRFLLEDFAQYVALRKRPEERVLLLADEFSALASGTDAANLFERVRSYGAAIIASSQSYQGLGRDADRMLSAAASVILFQSPDPDELTRRAGTRQGQARSYQTRQDTTWGNQAPTGSATIHEREQPKIDPNHARSLPVGQCFIISAGAYQRVQVARVQADPQLVSRYRQIHADAGRELPPLLAPVARLEPSRVANERPGEEQAQAAPPSASEQQASQGEGQASPIDF